jgi:aryl-alcohol dehydrogenase-like predicted oxidoreductase
VLSEADARPFFRRAIEAGINFFDTADMYALGMSEEVTGRALREYGRMEEIVLASKVYWPMAPGPNMRGLSRKHIVQACEASLTRLGVDTIDLYQIHRFDPTTPIEETLAALEHLVQSGKVRHIGASSGWAWQFARALGTSDRKGWSRFVSMQNHYNLLYREEEREMLPLCRSEGIGVIPWSPLARGFLAGNRTPGDRTGANTATARARSDDIAHRYYWTEQDFAIVDAVGAVADRHGVSRAQVAYAWVSSRPGVTAPIVGVSKAGQLDEALASLDLTLSAEDIAELEARYAPRPILGHA